MTLRRTMSELFRVVMEEAETNPEFQARLQDVLRSIATTPVAASAKSKRGRKPTDPRELADPSLGDSSGMKRPSNRRPAAVLDPVQLARQSEQVLRTALAQLSLDQLHDVVADYGMDPGKLVMKWRTAQRVVDRIVEVSMARSRKGDAFRDSKRGNVDEG